MTCSLHYLLLIISLVLKLQSTFLIFICERNSTPIYKGYFVPYVGSMNKGWEILYCVAVSVVKEII